MYGELLQERWRVVNDERGYEPPDVPLLDGVNFQPLYLSAGHGAVSRRLA